MPRKKKEKPLSGVGEKEERMYEHIKDSAKKSGRYGDRAAIQAQPVDKIRRLRRRNSNSRLALFRPESFHVRCACRQRHRLWHRAVRLHADSAGDGRGAGAQQVASRPDRLGKFPRLLDWRLVRGNAAAPPAVGPAWVSPNRCPERATASSERSACLAQRRRSLLTTDTRSVHGLRLRWPEGEADSEKNAMQAKRWIDASLW